MIRKTKIREGVVISDKMDKTVVVAVQRLVKHARYGKYIKRPRTTSVHGRGQSMPGRRPRDHRRDPAAQQGQRWRVSSIVEKAV